MPATEPSQKPLHRDQLPSRMPASSEKVLLTNLRFVADSRKGLCSSSWTVNTPLNETFWQQSCAVNTRGKWSPASASNASSLAECAWLCTQCRRCKWISYSTSADVCFWFSSCALWNRLIASGDFRSGYVGYRGLALRKRGSTDPQPAPRSPERVYHSDGALHPRHRDTGAATISSRQHDSVLIAIGVLSAPGNLLLRASIRDTWFSELPRYRSPHTMLGRFVVRSGGVRSGGALDRECRQDDMACFDHIAVNETRFRGPILCLAAWLRVAVHMGASFVMKTDDDTWVHVWHLSRSIYNSGVSPTQRVVFGTGEMWFHWHQGWQRQCGYGSSLTQATMASTVSFMCGHNLSIVLGPFQFPPGFSLVMTRATAAAVVAAAPAEIEKLRRHADENYTALEDAWLGRMVMEVQNTSFDVDRLRPQVGQKDGFIAKHAMKTPLAIYSYHLLRGAPPFQERTAPGGHNKATPRAHAPRDEATPTKVQLMRAPQWRLFSLLSSARRAFEWVG